MSRLEKAKVALISVREFIEQDDFALSSNSDDPLLRDLSTAALALNTWIHEEEGARSGQVSPVSVHSVDTEDSSEYINKHVLARKIMQQGEISNDDQLADFTSVEDGIRPLRTSSPQQKIQVVESGSENHRSAVSGQNSNSTNTHWLELARDALLDSVREDLSSTDLDLFEGKCSDHNFVSQWNKVVEVGPPRAKVILANLYDNCSRLALALLSLSIKDSSLHGRIVGTLWGCFTVLISTCDQPRPAFDVVLNGLEKLDLLLPEMHNFPNVCPPRQYLNLTNNVYRLHEQLMSFSVVLLRTVHLENRSFVADSTYTPQSLEKIFKQIDSISRDIDVDTLREWFWNSQDADLYEPYESGLALHNIPVPVSLNVSDAYLGFNRIYDAPIELLTEHFVGRLKTLDMITTELFSGKTSSPRFVLYGPASIGKTQIALKFAKTVMSASPATNVFWITGSSADSVARSLEHVLASQKATGRASKNHEARMALATHTLATSVGKNQRGSLLIIDDLEIEAFDTLRSYALGEPFSGPILFTTKSFGVATKLRKGPHVIDFREVPNLDAYEATNLLCKASGYDDIRNTTAAAKLVKLLDGVPLAVKHIGAEMKRDGNLELESVLSLCEGISRSSPTNPRNDIDKVDMAIQCVLQNFQSQQKRTNELLRALSFFNSESIPLGAMLKGFSSTNSVQVDSRRPQSPLFDDESELDAETSLTRSESFVTEEGSLKSSVASLAQTDHSKASNVGAMERRISEAVLDPMTQKYLLKELLKSKFVGTRSFLDYLTIRIHEAIRKNVMDQIEKDDCHEKYFREAVALLNAALQRLPSNLSSRESWQHCAILTPHFETLVRIDKSKNYKDDMLARGFLRLGRYYRVRGSYNRAIDCYQHCQDVLKEAERSEACEQLARSLMRQDKFKDARQILQRMLGLSDENDSFLISKENVTCAEALATCYYLQADLLLAEELYVRLRVFLTGKGKEFELQLAKVQEGLGNTYQRLGRPESAETLYEECLLFWGSSANSPYLSIQRTKYNQARLQRDMGHLDVAERMFQSLLDDYQRTIGPEHHDTLLVAARLANTYARQQKYEKAESLALRTLGAQLRKAARQPIAIAYTRWTLAEIYLNLERRASLGKDPDYIRRVLLGKLYPKRPRQAEGFFLAALHDYDVFLGAEHLFSHNVRRDLSHLYEITGRVAEGIKVLEEVRAEIKGRPAATKLARLYDLQGTDKDTKRVTSADNLQEAENLARETLKSLQKRVGKWHCDTNYALWVYASICRHMGWASKGDTRHQWIDMARKHYEWAMKGYARIPHAVFDNDIILAKEYKEFLQEQGDAKNADKVMNGIKSPERERPEVHLSIPELPLDSFDEMMDEGFYDPSVVARPEILSVTS